MSFNWKSALSSVAPMLATAVGGPFGGMAASAALKLLGVEPEKGNEESQLQEAMKSMTPEQAIKLKLAEKEFLKTMRELELKEEDLHSKDRDSARDLAKSTSIIPQVTLSTLYIIGYFVTMYMFLSGNVEIAQSIKSEFNILLGVMTAAQVQIMNFWLGSSAGSKHKTDKLK